MEKDPRALAKKVDGFIFQAASEAQKRAGASVQAGRDFVRAYVEFVHYAERLHKDATGGMPPHGAAACGHQAAPHEPK